MRWALNPARSHVPHELASISRRPVFALRVLAALGLIVYAVYSVTGFGGGGAEHLFEDWIYNALLATAALLCLLRALLVAGERAPWLLLGVGLACWSAGEVVYTAAPGVLDGAGFPSPVDLLWLAFYPAAYAALILLVRARVD